MRKATPQEIRRYKTYLRNHIDLVYTLGKKAFNMDFSGHDFDKIHGEGPKMDLMALRNVWHDKEYRPSEDVVKMFNELAFQHVKTNKHHPEYWDKKIRFEDFMNGDNTHTVDMSEMSTDAFNEMMCDWAAVAIKNNNPLMTWYEKTCFGKNPRFKMSQKQHKKFKAGMKKIYDAIVKYNIHYPGIEYDAVNNFEEKGTSYKTEFLESYICMKESKYAVSFKFKTPYDSEVFTKEMPYVWYYVDVSRPNIVTVYWDSKMDMTYFMNHLPKKTQKLIIDQKVLKEEVSSGAFGNFAPEGHIKISKENELESI